MSECGTSKVNSVSVPQAQAQTQAQGKVRVPNSLINTHTGWKARAFTGHTWSTPFIVWRWHLNAYFFACAACEGSKYSTATLPSIDAAAYPRGTTGQLKDVEANADAPSPFSMQATAPVMNRRLLSRSCFGRSIILMS